MEFITDVERQEIVDQFGDWIVERSEEGDPDPWIAMRIYRPDGSCYFVEADPAGESYIIIDPTQNMLLRSP